MSVFFMASVPFVNQHGIMLTRISMVVKVNEWLMLYE